GGPSSCGRRVVGHRERLRPQLFLDHRHPRRAAVDLPRRARWAHVPARGGGLMPGLRNLRPNPRAPPDATVRERGGPFARLPILRSSANAFVHVPALAAQRSAATLPDGRVWWVP